MTRRTMEDPKSIQKRFEAAVNVIRSLPEDGSYDLSDDMLVMLYSYYKQATAGPCNTLKPNSWDPIGKAKWEAWKALGNMTKNQAMMEYVQEIQLIIETLPVTEKMAELLDALDPFYEIVEDEDDDEDVASKAAQLSTGSTKAEKADDDEAEKDEEGGNKSNGENIEDDMEMDEKKKNKVPIDMHYKTDRRQRLELKIIICVLLKKQSHLHLGCPGNSSTLAAERGNLLVCNGSEENSVSSTTNDTHSSLNSEEEEEELAYDNSDDDIYRDSMEKPAIQEKGSGVPRVHLAEVNVVVANMQLGENRKPQCESQDGKPQGVTSPVPHPPTLGTVQTDRISPGSGRGCQLMGTNLPDKHECSYQGDGQHWETEDRTDKRAFNTEIAVILSQLQDNMQDVLHRLTTLELLTASQAEISPLKTLNSKSPKKRWPRWPLNLPPIAVVLVIIWPFAVHWLVQFYLLKRRRWLRVK